MYILTEFPFFNRSPTAIFFKSSKNREIISVPTRGKWRARPRFPWLKAFIILQKKIPLHPSPKNYS